MKKTELRDDLAAEACAVAAAKGAALMLREQQIVDEVEIILPTAEIVRYRLHGQKLVDDTASCYAIKSNGDDHDAISGERVYVSIKVDFFTPRRIVLAGRPRTDRAAEPEEEETTDPGPRPMILEVVREVFAMRCMPTTLTVTVGIPDEELEIAV